MSGASDPSPRNPHVVLLPSAGMGHLTPVLRLAASLVRGNNCCEATIITTHPIVSHAESDYLDRFFSAFPQVAQKQFHLLPIDPNTVNTSDAFWLQRETLRRSVHLLSSLLSSLHPPPSALIFDMTVASSIIPVTRDLNISNYMLFTSSAKMFSLFSYLPNQSGHGFAESIEVRVPGIPAIPISSIPPALLDPASLFCQIFMEDGKQVGNVDGVLINTFEGLESDTLQALSAGKVVAGLPPLFTIQLVPCEFERRPNKNDKNESEEARLKWLNEQRMESVLFVSFGSRTALSRDQIRELGEGLVRSGHKFLWVVKNAIVDKEEGESVEEVLGAELIEKVRERGLVVKEWVDQGEILSQGAVGGFVSHCGWNSVVESARAGVRMLAWPQNGDQKINAEVVERSGLGLWARDWGWSGQELVKGDEIAEKIKEVMENEKLRLQAKEMGDMARKAVDDAGGSCEIALERLIHEFKEMTF